MAGIGQQKQTLVTESEKIIFYLIFSKNKRAVEPLSPLSLYI